MLTACNQEKKSMEEPFDYTVEQFADLQKYMYTVIKQISKEIASLTNEMEQMLEENGISVSRGKHWTTDAGYRETWEQVLDYRSKGALCVEMEGVGLFTIAKYRKCSATAIYIITDTISEDGWHLGWEGKEIDKSIEKLIEVINC